MGCKEGSDPTLRARHQEALPWARSGSQRASTRPLERPSQGARPSTWRRSAPGRWSGPGQSAGDDARVLRRRPQQWVPRARPGAGLRGLAPWPSLAGPLRGPRGDAAAAASPGVAAAHRVVERGSSPPSHRAGHLAGRGGGEAPRRRALLRSQRNSRQTGRPNRECLGGVWPGSPLRGHKPAGLDSRARARARPRARACPPGSRGAP